MAALPEFTTTGEYLLFILSVTLTTLGLLAVGSVGKAIFSTHKAKATLKKKLVFFPLFIIGIFVMGWISATAQHLMFLYLQANVAASASGIAIAVVVAWILYDWAIWRSK